MLGGIGAEERDPARFPFIVPVVEASLTNIQGANVPEFRIRSGHQERGIVVIAVCADGLLLQFRNRILTIRALGLHRLNVRVFPMDDPPRARSPGLQAGAPVKHNHDVFAQIPRLVFLALAQTFSGGNH